MKYNANQAQSQSGYHLSSQLRPRPWLRVGVDLDVDFMGCMKSEIH